MTMARRRRNKAAPATALTESGAPRKAFDESKHRRAAGGRFGSGGGVQRASSSVDSPVRRMHALADKMHGKPRADILAAAQAIGINRSTASTQLYVYQRARAARELQAAATGVSSGNPREVLQAAAARALGVPPAPAATRASKPAAQPAFERGYHTGTDGKLYYVGRSGVPHYTGENGQQSIRATGTVKSAKYHGDGHSVGESVALHRDYLESKNRAAPKPPAPTPKPAAPVAGTSNRFAMRPGERPVAAFHRIADEMHDRPRSEVIATAVSAGVNRSTASVQYTQWQRNRGAGSVPTARAGTATPVAASKPAAATAPKPAAAKEPRKLIQDETGTVPPAARQLHDKLHKAASVFKDAIFSARYDYRGKLLSFTVARGQQFSGRDPRGVTISRSFTEDTVDHAYFQIGSDERTSGSAKTFLAETVKAYQDHGYKKVKVHANIDVGGYAWLRYGFKPNPSSRTSMTRALDNAVSNRSEIKQALGPKGVAEVRRLAAAGEFNKIAQITTPVKMSDGTSKPFGKYVFLGSDWYGHLPLKNKSAMDTFYKYAGADK